MDYIRPIELEKLLTNYQALTGLLESLTLQLETMFDENVDEIIQSMVFKRNLDGLPRGKGSISDRTGDIAVNLHADIKSEAREVCQELLLVESIIKKIDVSLRAIRPAERQIIELRYFQGLTWTEIAGKVISSPSQVKRRRNEILVKMTAVCRIPIEAYRKVMQLLGLY